jgi:hypothetical protein
MGVNDKMQGKTDINITDELAEIGILLYPRVQMSAALGLTDLFGVANRLSAEHGGSNHRELRISHWQSRNSQTLELGRVFDTHQQPPQKLVGLILPPNLFASLFSKITAPSQRYHVLLFCWHRP